MKSIVVPALVLLSGLTATGAVPVTTTEALVAAVRGGADFDTGFDFKKPPFESQDFPLFGFQQGPLGEKLARAALEVSKTGFQIGSGQFAGGKESSATEFKSEFLFVVLSCTVYGK